MKIEKEFKGALKAAVLATGAWLEPVLEGKESKVCFPPYYRAAVEYLEKHKREDLIESVAELINTEDIFDVCCMKHAKKITKLIDEGSIFQELERKQTK